VTAALLRRGQARAPAPAPCATLPALQLRVGRTCARRGAPVQLLRDRCEFVFALGGAEEVHVCLWFRDVASSVREEGASVTCRVRGANMEAFARAEGSGPHTVGFTFASADVAARFAAALRAGGGGGGGA
jgi:hypothetical protein